MLQRGKIKRARNTLEGAAQRRRRNAPDVPSEMCTVCPACKEMLFTADLLANANVCTACEQHFRLSARQRLHFTVDAGTFAEFDEGMTSENIIGFPEYDEKLRVAKLGSGENEGVVTGIGEIGGHPCAIFIMDPNFMMGSMGTVVGEKITRLFEHATSSQLPVVGYCASGGARMQEGILSLMQMAKVSGAVVNHSRYGNLYLAVLTDPTTGGVTASFAMQGDITVAEPGALIGFAGPRVIEQTTRQKLPTGFQRAEAVLQLGFLDDIVPRPELKDYITRVLALHGAGGVAGSGTDSGAQRGKQKEADRG